VKLKQQVFENQEVDGVWSSGFSPNDAVRKKENGVARPPKLEERGV
jgi:hypothetical protein